MSIFAPDHNILNELDAPPRDSEIGIICNIYDYDIERIQDPLFDWKDGFLPANMAYEDVEIPGILGEPIIVRRWSALGSAFVGTRLQYNNYKRDKLIELANKVPLDFIANELKIPVQQLTLRDVQKIIDNAGYSPRFVANVVDTNDIKLVYCRYLTIDNTFVDCGLAETHELNLLRGDIRAVNIGLFMVRTDWTIITYDSIDPNDLQPLIGVCNKCYQWIVYCWDNFIVMEPFDPEVFSIDPETGQITYSNNHIVRGKVFKKKKQADEYFDEQISLTKWFKNIAGCLQIPKLCYENNPEYDPENPDSKVLAGPFDTIEECEQFPVTLPTPIPLNYNINIPN